MKPSVILGRANRAVMATVVVFSLFLLLSGHNAPGGGFIGGLVAGSGLVLLWATGGASELRSALHVRPVWLIGVGLLLAQLTAAAGWVIDGDLLESTKLSFHLPLFGPVKFATPLVFDTGVYLVVVGLVAMVLTTLGEQEPAAAEHVSSTPSEPSR